MSKSLYNEKRHNAARNKLIDEGHARYVGLTDKTNAMATQYLDESVDEIANEHKGRHTHPTYPANSGYLSLAAAIMQTVAMVDLRKADHQAKAIDLIGRMIKRAMHDPEFMELVKEFEALEADKE